MNEFCPSHPDWVRVPAEKVIGTRAYCRAHWVLLIGNQFSPKRETQEAVRQLLAEAREAEALSDRAALADEP